MNKTELKQTIQNLKNDGFRVVSGYKYLFINEQGKVYNIEKGRYLKPTARNLIKPESKYLNVPKLVLQAFNKEPYRAGNITHIDGIKSNMNAKNIRYSRIFAPYTKPEPINDKIMTAIRCYFEVEKRYKVKDMFKTVNYLKMIIAKRNFFNEYSFEQNIEVFETYIKNGNIGTTATKHGLVDRDCNIIIKYFINILIENILTDLNKGILKINEFAPKKQPQPLREKSEKELIKDFEELKNEIMK